MGNIVQSGPLCTGQRVNPSRAANPVILVDEYGSSLSEPGKLAVKKSSLHNINAKVPMTDKQVFLVLQHWPLVQSEMQKTAELMFKSMFDSKPGVREAFSTLRSSDARNKEEVISLHSLVVLHALDDIIMNLDDEEAAVNMVFEQGITHAKFGTMSAQDFWAIEEPFLLAVSDTIGPKYTKSVATAYKTTIHFILKLFIHGFEFGVRKAFGPYGKP